MVGRKWWKWLSLRIYRNRCDIDTDADLLYLQRHKCFGTREMAILAFQSPCLAVLTTDHVILNPYWYRRAAAYLSPRWFVAPTPTPQNPTRQTLRRCSANLAVEPLRLPSRTSWQGVSPEKVARVTSRLPLASHPVGRSLLRPSRVGAFQE